MAWAFRFRRSALVLVWMTAGALIANSAPCAARAAEPLPQPIRAMIETALRGHDAATIAAVIEVAKKTAPDSLADIEAIEAGYRRQLAAAKAAKSSEARARLAEAGPLSLWRGDLELGGSRSTGSADSMQLYGAAKLSREGLNWTQKLSTRLDYGEVGHIKTADRFVLAYQPRLKLDQASYGYALAEYEHDRFLGYRDRYTVGLGFGVTAVGRPDLKVVLDAGPTLRYAQYYGRETEEQLAGRAAVSAAWTLRPDLILSEDAALYVDRLHTTARSTLSLKAKLVGPLEARLAYDVHYERDAPASRRQSDAVTRATLAYNF